MSEALCKPCEERGRKQEAHRMVHGTPMCQWCFAGQQHPADRAKEREISKVAKGQIQVEVKEEKMGSRICGCGCGETLRKDNTTGFKTGHKRAGGGETRPAPRAKKANGSNGGVTIAATPELVNAVWSSLPLEKQAALINKLGEI